MIVIGFIPSIRSETLKLASKSQTDYQIIIPDKPIKSEKKAASELKKHLKMIAGVEFLIKTCSELNDIEGGKYIFVGPSLEVKRRLSNLPWDTMGTDRIIIKNVNDQLIIAGGRPRGTLYATYTFLEDVLGCRWWTSTESYIPHKKDILLSNLDIDYEPEIKDYRVSYYNDVTHNAEFCAKLKVTGPYASVSRCSEYGGGIKIIPRSSHTHLVLLPPDKYFNEHPEWYGMNDRRTPHCLCLANPEMRMEMIAVINQLLDKPENQEDNVYVMLSAPDGGRHCKCRKCQSLVKNEGALSGPFVIFESTVAEEVRKKHPNVKFTSVLYWSTIKPPKHAKYENFTLKFCTSFFSMCDAVNSPFNMKRWQDYLKWREIMPNNKFWGMDYNTIFRDYLQPFPFLKVAADNIKIFANNGATAYFMHGDGHCSLGDFNALRAWTIAHILWNPKLNYNELEREFLNGYYGVAAPYIQKYLELLHNAAVQDNKFHLDFEDRGMGFLNAKIIIEAAKLFDHAINAVNDNPKLKERVRKIRCSILYAAIKFALRGDFSFEKEKIFGFSSLDTAIDELEYLIRKYKPYRISVGSKRPLSRPENLLKLLRKANAGGKEWQDEPGILSIFNFQEPDAVVYGAKIIEDPKATNGLTVLFSREGSWDLNYTLSQLLKANSTYVLNVRVRCKNLENISNDKPVFQFGFSNRTEGTIKRIVTRGEILDDQYHTYKLRLSPQKLRAPKSKKSACVWGGTLMKNANVVIDRMFITHNSIQSE